MVIVYSGISKDLIITDFNNRVDEILVAGWLLQVLSGMELTPLADVKLRDIPAEVFEQYKGQLPERFRKRATHFYTEQERLKKGIKSWGEGDLETFGQMMFESGERSFF